MAAPLQNRPPIRLTVAEKRVLVVGLFFLCVVAVWTFLVYNPFAKLFHAGPFSGQVVDAETGRPVAGAFVGFTWSGSGWIAGHSSHLWTVLTQADANGRYALPWQGGKLDLYGFHSVYWSVDAWAPGYVTLRANDGRNTRRDSVSRSATIPLHAAASTMEALELRNRMVLDEYDIFNQKYKDANNTVQRQLGLVLYRDAFHRTCVETLPDEAIAWPYVLTAMHDYGEYLGYEENARHQFFPDHRESDKSSELKKRYGEWERSPGLGTEARSQPFRREWLPEICRLSRFDVALMVDAP